MHTFCRFTAAAVAAVSLTGCFSQGEDSDPATDGGTATLSVTTRAATGSLPYPVKIIAYDTEGVMQGEQTLADDASTISLQLNEGIYHISAIAGYDAYVAPSSYESKSATLTIPTAGYADSPLLMGGADVLLGTGNASVSVVLSYRVASLNISLADIPEEVTAMTIGISQQYRAIDMGGTLSGSSVATVSCSKADGLWQSGTIYLLSGTGTTTTLTLSLTQPSGQTSYSYELSEGLQAAVPYNIQATYVASTAPVITGVLTMEGWQAERSLSFEFGSGTSGSSSVSVPTVSVSAIPEAGAALNGHVVALVQNATETEADVLLLSLAEQDGVYSPTASGHETEMADYVAAYKEGELSGWAVPTEAEARQLRAAYAGNFDALNTVIASLGGAELAVYANANNNARWLCENGTKTFNFASSGSITTAGSSVKYRLRMVKALHVVVK